MIALQGAIFHLKAQIAFKLQNLAYQTPELIAFRKSLVDDMVRKVRELNKENFAVRQHLKYVELYSNPDNYTTLSYEDTLMMGQELAPLILPEEDDAKAVRFDALMYGIELAYLAGKNTAEQKAICCAQQVRNIEVCRANGWPVPRLIIADPAKQKDQAEKEKARKDRKAKIKRRVIGAVIVILAIVVIVLFAIRKSRKGKVLIPFDASYAIGLQCDDVIAELARAGFLNIKTSADNSGWLPGNQVLAVYVDNSGKYEKGERFSPDVSILIKHSSDGRIDVSDILTDWQNQSYSNIVDAFKAAGFTRITTDPVDTLDKSKDQRVSEITLNHLPYYNGDCYLPTDAPIEISYYTLEIRMGNVNTEYIGKDYQTVVADLEEKGFTNVQTEAVLSGWAKGNTVVDVTDGVKSCRINNTYARGAKIVVKYSSNDRIDTTPCLTNWRQQDYQILQAALKGLGFTDITVKEKETAVKDNNHLVASVTMKSMAYTEGDCYLQKNTPIVLEYYRLKIKVDKSAEDYEDYENYTELVQELKKLGFNNIELQRSNDLNIWQRLRRTKEGSIKSIYINGVDSFDSTDAFFFDEKIVIVVNTKENEGCEDITIPAKTEK